jgi:hypothetical protein
MSKDDNEPNYPTNEARKRFEAALKGARLAGHKPMESLTRKTGKKQGGAKKEKPKASD